mmetsp:Transcript_26058/g.43465  ORF Transcript_26058/g.43465 Transcript_26058/m.43465 type:complete len:99 (+) Transcript_26058:551-847(+)|eukprot:CAMPEP_0174283668 /NCGR_PEP_ID=MMETSP0809-20121228/4386_1 /TAXON_ID=73025 ORGANISM="Eutreptiella gymnastica-like, Strain CCMP1594" /NCGR_SAMPLE_ID=MMETSP0809 /ASSEMBLY_ACC=CAM_ASM_000658 /LENGTH=98 /DNA_ID=CAMNT_0015378745 /DNA_START=15 /DNA_END=311 /DNA_ORIENTATION=+
MDQQIGDASGDASAHCCATESRTKSMQQYCTAKPDFISADTRWAATAWTNKLVTHQVGDGSGLRLFGGRGMGLGWTRPVRGFSVSQLKGEYAHRAHTA